MKFSPIDNSTLIQLTPDLPELGSFALWVPEAIETNTGTSAVYPVGDWQRTATDFRQVISVEKSIGPGNCPKIDANTFECEGIRTPADNPVEWETRVKAVPDGAAFTIRLTNRGDTPMHKVGAAICFKLLQAAWWSDATTFAVVEGEMVSLATLGREAGQPNGFQAYLLKGQTYEHIFMREFWGFNRHRLDTALLVSEYAGVGVCVGIQSAAAYCMHSNPSNPCTDMLLAFGDILPGKSAEASGRVWIRKGTAQEVVDANNNQQHKE